MGPLEIPDADGIQRWLGQAGIEYYICDQCHGFHITALQSREGVTDARLFIEEEGLLLSTELELRPSSLFLVQADLGRLNMSFPTLKVFIDINDETLPRLVGCDLLLTRHGVSYEQFEYFLQASIDASHMLLDDCQQNDCLMGPEPVAGEEEAPLPPLIH